MSIGSVKGNLGVNQADLLRQQELTEPARRGNFNGLQARQVPPPSESPLEGAAQRPQSITSAATGFNPAVNNINQLDQTADATRGSAAQLQANLTRTVNTLQQMQATAKGNENPNAAGGVGSPEGLKKGEGASRAGLADGVSGARKLEATNDPVRAKDNGETGAARAAAGPTDQIAQIMAKVVELQKQLLSQLEQKPQGIE